MERILLLGSGKIGRTIATLLLDSGDYQVRVADMDADSLARLKKNVQVETLQLDASSPDQLAKAMQGCRAVISALSFRFNPGVAQAALDAGISYFDLTEDVETTRQVRKIAGQATGDQVFMPQCGLAPGVVSIVAYHLTKEFEQLDSVRMRVGALPQFPTGALKYNLTWSTDGLINEYCNPCEAIHEGQRIDVLPLEGLEHFSLDGVRYEAFNTSGGLGTLCETLDGRLRNLDYKTIRYLGHRDLMAFLVGDLRMSEDRDTLKTILERSVPITYQDVVVLFCTVSGIRNGQLVQLCDARKIYHQEIAGQQWSAIQVTTASGICAVIDLWSHGHLPQERFLRQEQVELDTLLDNRFGQYYRSTTATQFCRGVTEDLESFE